MNSKNREAGYVDRGRISCYAWIPRYANENSLKDLTIAIRPLPVTLFIALTLYLKNENCENTDTSFEATNL